MNTHNLTKQQRLQLVIEGVLPVEYISHEEVLEVLEHAENFVFQRKVEKMQTHYTTNTSH